MIQLAVSGEAHAPPAVSLNRPLWCALDASAHRRAANCQVLLLDVNFADAAWWSALVGGHLTEREASAAGYFEPRVASDLLRETLTLAWIVARADPGQATIFLAMAPQVASLFASFSPADLARLCAHHDQILRLRLRFDDRPSYWRMHLRIASRKLVCDLPRLDPLPEDFQQSLF